MHLVENWFEGTLFRPTSIYVHPRAHRKSILLDYDGGCCVTGVCPGYMYVPRVGRRTTFMLREGKSLPNTCSSVMCTEIL